MAGRVGKRKNRGRKTAPKRRNLRRKTDGGKVSLMRNTLVADRMICKLSYKDNINLTGVSPADYSIWNGRLNSLYDIDYGVVNGHQPLGFDQWGAFYQKYRVFKAAVSVTFINNTTTGVQVGVLPYNYINGNISSIGDDDYEQPHVATKTIAGNAGMNKGVVRKVVDIPRILGKSHLQYKSSDDTAATWTASPQQLCNLAVFARTINGAAPPTVQAIINLTLYCEFFDRKQQNLSYPAGKDPNGAFTDRATGQPIAWNGSTISFLQTLPFQYISTISSP